MRTALFTSPRKPRLFRLRGINDDPFGTFDTTTVAAQIGDGRGYAPSGSSGTVDVSQVGNVPDSFYENFSGAPPNVVDPNSIEGRQISAMLAAQYGVPLPLCVSNAPGQLQPCIDIGAMTIMGLPGQSSPVPLAAVRPGMPGARGSVAAPGQSSSGTWWIWLLGLGVAAIVLS
jgi:hypothetical protein